MCKTTNVLVFSQLNSKSHIRCIVRNDGWVFPSKLLLHRSLLYDFCHVSTGVRLGHHPGLKNVGLQFPLVNKMSSDFHKGLWKVALEVHASHVSATLSAD